MRKFKSSIKGIPKGMPKIIPRILNDKMFLYAVAFFSLIIVF